jgi:uncharacterized protein YebE (UPF0316 family)
VGDPLFWLECLFIFACRICDVSLTTIRTLMVVRGERVKASVLGFFEVLIYVNILSLVVSSMDNPIKVVSYCLGFAAGTFTGSIIEEKLAIGNIFVQIVTLKEPEQLADMLRSQGYGVTLLDGHGMKGDRHVLQVVVKRKAFPLLKSQVYNWDPNLFLTAFDTRMIKGGMIKQWK